MAYSQQLAILLNLLLVNDGESSGYSTLCTFGTILNGASLAAALIIE
jgi:hypothetical protein